MAKAVKGVSMWIFYMSHFSIERQLYLLSDTNIRFKPKFFPPSKISLVIIILISSALLTLFPLGQQ